jgi:transcriptional accessory protein Tex/SPT6
MSNQFVKSPLDILSVGDVIDVTFKAIDFSRGRVSLTRLD